MFLATSIMSPTTSDPVGLRPFAPPALSGPVGEQLHGVPQLPRVLHVPRADLRDPLPVDVLHLHPALEGYRAQDRQLEGGIEPLHVVRRVRLRIPEPLRLLQSLVALRPAPRRRR